MWEMRCDKCGQAYHSKTEDMKESKIAATRAGWVVGAIVECPSCLSAEGADRNEGSGVDGESGD